eukprot:COSAG01_NODE_11684_length_1879_cov_236.520787_3_plen_125_part_00
MDEKGKKEQKAEREKQAQLKKWSMTQETLDVYDEREKELLKLEQRWRTKILKAKTRKRRQLITKEWRKQNTALRKEWAKRICKAAKNDYRKWFDTVVKELVGWLEHPNQATGQARSSGRRHRQR